MEMLEIALSGFGVSVGTGLALQALFDPITEVIDPDRKPPVKIDPESYQEFWVNISTLFRNIYHAIPAKQHKFLQEDQLFQMLISEISVLHELFSSKKTKLLIYACDYGRVYSEQSIYVDLRKDSTESQKAYSKLHSKVIRRLIKENHVIFHRVDLEIPKRSTCLMMTHYPWDLLSKEHFRQLDLLESHTGVIKNRFQFYTKFYKGHTLSQIPFNRVMLKIMGDNVMFSPMPRKIKGTIVEHAQHCGWSQVTTQSKMFSDLNQLKDKYLIEVIKTL